MTYKRQRQGRAGRPGGDNGDDTLRKAARTLLLVAGFAVLGVLLGEWMVASEKEERRRHDMEQAERNRAMQRMQDSLDREAARRRVYELNGWRYKPCKKN